MATYHLRVKNDTQPSGKKFRLQFLEICGLIKGETAKAGCNLWGCTSGKKSLKFQRSERPIRRDGPMCRRVVKPNGVEHAELMRL